MILNKVSLRVPTPDEWAYVFLLINILKICQEKLICMFLIPRFIDGIPMGKDKAKKFFTEA